MREERQLVVRVRYVPEVRDRFTRVAAHYIVQPQEGVTEGKGESLYAALREAGIESWSDTVQIVPEDWPQEILDEWREKQHAEALCEEKRRENTRIAAEKQAALRARIAAHAKTWDMKGQELPIWVSGDEIEVHSVSRYNAHFRRHETAIRSRRFRPNKGGDYNWEKLREACEQVAAYKFRESTEWDKKARADASSGAIIGQLTVAGLRGWRPNGDGGVSFTVSATTFEEAQAISAALAEAQKPVTT